MFSSNAFIQLVFANKQDKYYSDDLLKLSLEQYLWIQLHEKYDIVYFLHIYEDMLSAYSFGDRNAGASDSSAAKKKLFKGKEQKFCDWMKARLASRHLKYAFVCFIEEIYDLSSCRPPWNKALNSLADIRQRSGTIIMIIPPVAEKAGKYLLDPVPFIRLCDPVVSGVGSGVIKDIYSHIKSNKGDSCEFLNSFTKKRISDMLICLCTEDISKAFPGREKLEYMSEYLTQYLNNVQLQWKERLFEKTFNAADPLYCDVYEQLKNDDVFSRLEEYGEGVKAAGGMRQYLRNKGICFVSDDRMMLRMSHENGSYAWKCKALPPFETRDDQSPIKERSEDMLLDILEEIGMLRNQKENQLIISEILNILREAENSSRERDIGTYKRALYSLRFCMQFIYTGAGCEERIIGIIGHLKSYIRLSESCYTKKKNAVYYGTGQMGEKVKKTLRENSMASEKLLEKFDDIIPVTLSTCFQTYNQNEQELLELMGAVQKDLDDKIKIISDSGNEDELSGDAAAEPEENENGPSSDDVFAEVDSEFSESFYNFRPPDL